MLVLSLCLQNRDGLKSETAEAWDPHRLEGLLLSGKCSAGQGDLLPGVLGHSQAEIPRATAVSLQHQLQHAGLRAVSSLTLPGSPVCQDTT